MAHFQTRIRTPWAASKAFPYLVDMSNFAEWDPGTKNADLTDGHVGALGARYRLEVGAATLDYEIVELEPGSRMQAEGHSNLFTSIDSITVDGNDTGSVVTYDAKLTLNGPLGIADPLLGILFKRMGEKAADGLSKKLDGTRLS